MKTLHVRAESSVIEKLLDVINEFSHNGKDVEVFDNLSYELEKKLISKGLEDIDSGQVYSHEDVWKEILN